jgi:hypothetical protein
LIKFPLIVVVLQDYRGVNILNGKIFDTPNALMKALINDLFTKAEVMQGKHEEANERTERIQGEHRNLEDFFKLLS